MGRSSGRRRPASGRRPPRTGLDSRARAARRRTGGTSSSRREIRWGRTPGHRGCRDGHPTSRACPGPRRGATAPFVCPIPTRARSACRENGSRGIPSRAGDNRRTRPGRCPRPSPGSPTCRRCPDRATPRRPTCRRRAPDPGRRREGRPRSDWCCPEEGAGAPPATAPGAGRPERPPLPQARESPPARRCCRTRRPARRARGAVEGERA